MNNLQIKLKVIKILITTGLFLIVLTAFSISADAQDLVSLTSGGFATAAGTKPGTPPSNQTPAGTNLVVTVNFGDISPSNVSGKVVCIVPIRLSAATEYKVEIQKTGSLDDSGLQSKDIGFGIGNFRLQNPGSNHITNNALSIITSGSFLNDPSKATISKGKPNFLTTLENIPLGVKTTLFTGVATTDPANLGKDGGSILADLTFVVMPQYFSPSDGTNMTLMLSITPVN